MYQEDRIYKSKGIKGLFILWGLFTTLNIATLLWAYRPKTSLIGPKPLWLFISIQMKTLKSFTDAKSRCIFILFLYLCLRLNDLRLQFIENISWEISKRCPRVIPFRVQTNISLTDICHIYCWIFSRIWWRHSRQPSLNRKHIEIFQSLSIRKIFKTINSFCSSSLHILQQFHVRYMYSKFQTH